MPSSFRSPRTLAGWLELDYFRRRGLFRPWWRGSLVLAAVVALAGLGVMLAYAGNRTFQAGPLSPPHALFNDRCELCHKDHGTTLTRLWRGPVSSVSNDACKACHAGSHHNPPHTDTGNCVDCHREHRGHAALVRVGDSRCTQCHKNLQRNDGIRSIYNARVVSFDDRGGHPPFRRTAAGGGKDPGTLRFNHQVHTADSGVPVAGDPHRRELLECFSCHQQDAAGSYMKPISYETHCQRCHPLSVQLAGPFAAPGTDRSVSEAARNFADRSIRHPGKTGSAATARADLRDRLSSLIAGPLGERLLAVRPEKVDRRFPWPAEDAPLAEKRFAWVEQQLSQTQATLFEAPGGCRYCHTPESPARDQEGLPVFQPTNIRQRWWDHAQFSHSSHRMMRCDACHDAKKSATASDVLLPGFDTCLKCHNKKSTASARADCVECHVYHDPKTQQFARERGSLSLEQILGK